MPIEGQIVIYEADIVRLVAKTVGEEIGQPINTSQVSLRSHDHDGEDIRATITLVLGKDNKMTSDELAAECIRLGADRAAVGAWPDAKRLTYIQFAGS